MAADVARKGTQKLPTAEEVSMAAFKLARNQESAKAKRERRKAFRYKLINMSREARSKRWSELDALRKAGGLTLQQCGEWDFLCNPKYSPQVPTVAASGV